MGKCHSLLYLCYNEYYKFFGIICDRANGESLIEMFLVIIAVDFLKYSVAEQVYNL